MKKYNFFTFLLLVSLLFSLVSSTQGGWEQVAAPQSGYDLYGIYFKDIDVGVCSKFKTTNGGQNWYQPTLIGGGYAMMFPDLNTGYLTGTNIYKTTNLGENWSVQTNPTGGTILYGVYLLNVNTGYASGELGKIVKTTNGGTNWTLLTSGISSSYYLHGIFFTDNNTGFVTGFETSNGSSIIAKTTNGGLNWDIQNFSANSMYSAIYFINSATGIVIGQVAGKTTDGGASWVTKPYSGSIMNSLIFPSSNIGYAAGYSGNIMKTTNGGESWYRLTTGVTPILRSIHFLNDNTGFACGNNGVVLKTTDGGGPPFGIQQINSEVPKDYSLSQNYPNPFNPFTNIEFKIAKAGFVIIKIYAITGNEIKTLVNTNLRPGIYKTDWDASNYSSGIYYYKLTTSDYSESKKMVLVK